MNFKKVCKVAVVLTLLSILMTLIGHVITQIPMMTRHVHLQNMINIGLAILVGLLEASGFTIFLLGLIKQFNRPSENSKGLFILAAIIILLGTFIGIGLNLTSAVWMYKHMASTQFIFHAAIGVSAFLSAVCLSVFIFTQMQNSSAAKPLAVLTLVTTFILLGLFITRCVMNNQIFTHGTIFQIIAIVIMWMGYFIKEVAIIIVMLAYIMQRPLPPESEAMDPPPEPLSTLSVHVPIPEE